MKCTRVGGRCLWIAAAVGIVGGTLLLVGCGGGEDTCCPPYVPQYRDLTLVLNVSDADGNALGEATVWVDGVAQDIKTAWEFVTLGPGYPESWSGFRANWIKGGYRVRLDDYTGWTDVIVMVSKTGYVTQSTRFRLDAFLPQEVFARETFIMERSARSASADPGTAVEKPKPGEVVGMETVRK